MPCYRAANIAPVGEWLGEGGKKMAECDMADPDLVHVRRMSYDLKCNWKIFVENYLDGCYHWCVSGAYSGGRMV